MHSSRMRSARSLPYGGISLTETPPDRDPPGQRLPLDRSPPPPNRPDRDPPVNRITDRCKNITFPQLRLRAVIRWREHICVNIFTKLLMKYTGASVHPRLVCTLNVHGISELNGIKKDSIMIINHFVFSRPRSSITLHLTWPVIILHYDFIAAICHHQPGANVKLCVSTSKPLNSKSK